MKHVVVLAAVFLCVCRPGLIEAGEKPYGIGERTPWVTSRIKGSPEPPPPYQIVNAFPRLTFKDPLHLTTAPGSNRFFVCEQGAKIYSFPIDPACARADLVIDLGAELQSWDRKKVRLGDLYSQAFHPQFAKNRYCYLCYILHPRDGNKKLPDGTRIARFRVTDTDPPRIDPASEQIIITWLGGGHNGCDLHFGPDGFLYISTGDGANPNPPDALNTGQDLGDLLSSILRIDVDRAEKGKPYAIPLDNPFVKMTGARPEIWAYGFRNPWRMSFDRQTGDLWVGDVGWELWEMIYRVKKGGNYGWSVMEGPQPVRPESKRGPTPILPPALALPHTEAASITGGYVYRGRRFKDLQGVYLCGDWVTRKVWGTRFDGDKIVWHKELAQGKDRIVAFGEDHDKEIYLVNHDEKGSILKLVPNEAVKAHTGDFPRKLSETGLFSSVKDGSPAAGVVPFSVNAEIWADGATAERWVGLPDTSTVKLYTSQPPWPDDRGKVHFPRDGVLAKTFTLELEPGNLKSRRRLETQVLHFDGTVWNGYTYAWNDEQTDANLVDSRGMDRTVTIRDAKAEGGRREQRWHYPSRAECATCHNSWANYTLAFNTLQLNKVHDYGGARDSQLRTMRHLGMTTFLKRDWEAKAGKDEVLPGPPARHLVNPWDTSAKIEDRARSYLHVNCSHCHQLGAGGTATIDLRYDIKLEKAKVVQVRPAQGTFEIPGGQIVAPGDPYRSILYYRLSKLGPGRMPHLGSDIVDERGLRLIHDWIRGLAPGKIDRTLLDKLSAETESPVRARLIGQLLSSTHTASMLASACGTNEIAGPVRTDVLAAAMAQSNSQVRDLFERFVPESQRTKRLGSVIRPEQILAKKGSAERGRELFFKSAGLQCASCHRVAGTGSTLGPDLSDVGKKYTRAKILESILEPSKFIDPKYVTYLVETTDGQVLTGLLAEKTDRIVVLKMAGDKEIRLEAKRVSAVLPQQKSLMPELLLRDLTLEQAADLLEYLAELK